MDSGDSQIIEEHFAPASPNVFWVNFLSKFIDFEIVQNKDTGEIYAVKSQEGSDAASEE